MVTAAASAQADGARRTHTEKEAGFIAIAEGRELGNGFVSDIARQAMDVFDDPEDGSADAPDFADTEVGIAGLLERAKSAVQLLDAKADPADSSVYRGWLITIADVVVGAGRSGAVLGMGGDAVTGSERRFRDRLVQNLQL